MGSNAADTVFSGYRLHAAPHFELATKGQPRIPRVPHIPLHIVHLEETHSHNQHHLADGPPLDTRIGALRGCTRQRPSLTRTRHVLFR